MRGGGSETLVTHTHTHTHRSRRFRAAGNADKPGQGYPAVHEGTIVRRLTPLECERLQGYDDGWTDTVQADSARYRQLGNSVAVPCVEWVARRLVAVDEQIR